MPRRRKLKGPLLPHEYALRLVQEQMGELQGKILDVSFMLDQGKDQIAAYEIQLHNLSLSLRVLEGDF